MNAPGNILIFPAALVLAVLLGGLALALIRPYWAFLASIAISIGIGGNTLTYSRLPEGSPFFNLRDAALCVAVVAAVANAFYQRNRLVWPKIATAMVLVLLLGAANTSISLGFTYDTLKALRAALSLPINYWVGANLVTTEKQVKRLLLTCFVATLGAEIQHLIYFVGGSAEGISAPGLRSLDYSMGQSAAWLIAGPFMVNGRIRRPLLQFAVGVIFLAANITHQTRSVALGAMIGIVFLYGWFVRGALTGSRSRLLSLAAVIAVTLSIIVPYLSLGEAAHNYVARMARTIDVESDSSETIGRRIAFEIEMRDWRDSNLALGRGLEYFQVYNRAGGWRESNASFGHLGYITYLSQLGLLGFFVYALWFPFHVLRRARRQFRNSLIQPATRHWELLVGAVFLYDIAMFFFSSDFLGSSVLPGLMAGFVTSFDRSSRSLPYTPDPSRDHSSPRILGARSLDRLAPPAA